MQEQYILLKTDDYCVLEKDTGLVIQRFTKPNLAKNLKEKLDKGCGFQGNTPPFFVRTVKQTWDVFNGNRMH